MWPSLLGFLNQLLTHHNAARVALKAHAGRKLLLTMAPFSFSWRVTENGQFEAVTEVEKYDLEVSVPGTAMPLLFESTDKFKDQMQVTGNVAFAGALMQLAEALPDAAAAEADRWFGPVLSYMAMKALKQLLSIFRATHESLMDNMGHYWRDESKDLVSQKEGELFANDVQQLQKSTMNLEIRLRQLGAKK